LRRLGCVSARPARVGAALRAVDEAVCFGSQCVSISLDAALDARRADCVAGPIVSVLGSKQT